MRIEQIIKNIDDRLKIIEQRQKISYFKVSDDGIFILPVMASDPATGVEGQLYFNSTTNKVTVYDGTSWVATH